MKPAVFDYHAPATRDEALGLLATLDDARVLAGGQSLMPLMNLRLAAPAHLVDLNRVTELSGIGVDGGELVIGAMTRQREAERSALVARVCPMLVAALERVGVQQVRNRGTVGGSIAHLDPTAELWTAAVALDGAVTLESVRGVRRLPVSEFALDYLTTALEPDEMLTKVHLPLWPAGHGYAFDEVTRRGDSYAVVSAAALAIVDGSGAVERISVAIGGMTHAPVLLAEAGSLVGRRPTAADLEAVAATAAHLPSDDDAFTTAAYKQRLGRALSRRTMTAALARATEAAHG